ncbi:T9SS type B sorting domain-containing protein [Flavobacterium sufflavum]|uniref:T9SS type B sorting domain-containing protein n=1 Tax=Flavobacterium sufflavum TaxID=1921138 RepID=A0A3S3SW84_9FLAO|nr:T9SS type B sorting domain-containing protein [Flavobacterium sufflavum]RVT76462.1 T9SS type B sorting domain-containing protein [Flavobacterium sufflavum]
MFKKIVLLLLVLSFQFINAQITLTNNIGTTLIKTDMYSCLEDENWGRVFKLSDFGIAPNEQFIIKSGQIGISKSDIGSKLYFSVYIYDENFPGTYNSYFEKPLLGTRGVISTKTIDSNPEIMQIDFDSPIIVPAGVEKIIVLVGKGRDYTNYTQAKVFVAGTQEDNGDSWYVGCNNNQLLKPTTEMNIPVPNANFYITVTGDVSNVKSSGPVTRLSHNICDDLLRTDMYGCYGTTYYWARDFNLKDFGISPNEEFVINSGQVGVNNTAWGATVRFNFYKIDNNFPASFSETNLIGSSQTIDLPPSIGHESQIIQLDFNNPIIIPAGVEKILVEVQKGGNPILGGGSQAAFIAGSTQDNGISWFKGCARTAGIPNNEYFSTTVFGVPNANYYINVTGKVNNISNHFEMNYTNNCSDFLKEFSIDDETKMASVVWDFGDPTSGIDNTSTDLSPYHDFSSDGTYTITARVTAKDGTVENLSETIDVKEPPKAYGINNISACENSFNTGFSTSFDTSTINLQVLGGQINKVITFIDGKGNKYNSLPNPFTNTVKNRETITVRVSHKDNLCCYSETTFDLIVNPLPDITLVKDLKVCDNTNNGYSTFNLNQVKLDILGIQTNLQIEFYHENGQLIVDSELGSVTNSVKNLEVITVKATNLDTNCFSTTTFKLIVSYLPVANTLNNLTGCDDNNDGISEYFDTSNIESTVLGNQTGMQVSYFDSNGNQLPSPLPNPYTNLVPNQETIIVRVTNSVTNCYSETSLNLATSTKPQINQPQNLYACDEGNGFSHFDTSTIKNQIIGNQTGLIISYSDENGNNLLNPSSPNYQNTTAWSQTINVKVENQLNPLCYSETSFKLIVNELPQINLESNYYLCDLEPSLSIATNPDFDTWEWKYKDNTIISNSFEANLIEAGQYTLRVSKTSNGISCENSFSFKLIRSNLPKIQQVNNGELGNNFIEIIATGNGDFEYSIDGITYQDSNYFSEIAGGNYTVHVRDKKGCGEDSSEVTIIDYPKFFTPNNDGFNDFWQVKGINKFPNSKIFIFDRYGKFLKHLTANSSGWDGLYNGKEINPDDYWFKIDFGNGKSFSGHFTLKR